MNIIIQIISKSFNFVHFEMIPKFLEMQMWRNFPT